MSITLISHKKNNNGLRPLKPSRDLSGVADLIEEAFSTELDQSGRAALNEMRWMGRWGLFLFWLDFLSPDVNTHLNGFVWVDEGKIVGNISVNHNSPYSTRWFISNVAVAKSHRGQGIARQLMIAAIEYVKEMRGKTISLQVRKGNATAIHLYQSLGFRYISASSFFYKSRPGYVEVAPYPKEVTLRPHSLNADDGYAAYNLAKATIPANIQYEKPLRQEQFRLGLEIPIENIWRSLSRLGKIKYWVVEDSNGELIATLKAQPGTWQNDHKLSFMVHPDWWGKLEVPLISSALQHLKTCPVRPISFQHAEEHPDGIKALQDLGFKIKHTHIWMKLAL